MLAYAFLVVAAVTEHAQRPAPPWMVELTCSETQHLLAALVAVPVADRGHRLRWSAWRRRHQARARTTTTADRQPGIRDKVHDLRLATSE
jgi:hypothetical protein